MRSQMIYEKSSPRHWITVYICTLKTIHEIILFFYPLLLSLNVPYQPSDTSPIKQTMVHRLVDPILVDLT